MSKIRQIRITKIDGTEHLAPASELNIRELTLQNKIAPADKRSKLEFVEVDEKGKVTVEIIHQGSIIIDAKKIQADSAEKDAEIERLKAELEKSHAPGADAKKIQADSAEKAIKK